MKDKLYVRESSQLKEKKRYKNDIKTVKCERGVIH